MTLSEAQADMRRAYLCGIPGVVVSGVVWIVASGIAWTVSAKAGVLALLVGGACIFPASVLLVRRLGGTGAHDPANRLGTLALEGTFWMLGGIVVAYGVQAVRIEWFFPAMLLVIGGRYLTFQSIYGLRSFWVLGGALCAAGMALGLFRAAPAWSALAGGLIEVAFAGVLYSKRGSTLYT